MTAPSKVGVAQPEGVREALREACGEVGEEPASGVAWVSDPAAGGTAVFVARPESTEAAAAVMRVAAQYKLAVVLRGGGSRLAWGTPPTRCDLVVDTARLCGVVEHAAGDLVARVRAGTRMAEVAAVLAEAGQEIALDVPGEATVGGVVASGLAGPRRLRYGTPRDLLIGVTMVRADGVVAKSGGKVVKNVAGYDLGKLLAGSDGTLGLITEVTFRLHPRPAARAWVTAEYAAVPAACDAVAAAANSPLTASAVEISRRQADGPVEVGVLLEGSADGVAARAARMSDLLGPPAKLGSARVAESPPAWWPGVADAAGTGGAAGAPGTDGADGAAGGTTPAAPGPGGDELRVRVSFWVSQLGRVLNAVEAAAALAQVNAVVSGSAGAGLLDVSLGHPAATDPSPAGDWAPQAADFIGRLRAALAGQRGNVAVLAAPAAVRERLSGSGGMQGAVPGRSLMRAVKDQFDPGHRLAAGRFPDGLDQ